MRLRRKKGDDDEVVSGEVMPEMATQDDTVDMEAVAPATPAGGASRPDDHGERTNDDSTTALQQATGQGGPAGGGPAASIPVPAAGSAGKEADRRAEEARLADEQAARAQREAEEAAEAQREADERARAEAERERADRAAAAASTSVSGASIASPGLGGDASPKAAAAANAFEPEPAPAADAAGSGEDAGPLAPILEHPAVQKKPELLVAGGLAAGFVFAKILKAITSPDA